MTLPFLVSLSSYFKRNPPKPPTVSQDGIQARAVRHLIAHGSITAWDIVKLGTTDCHKMLTRMRRMGILFDAEDILGFRWQDNKSGHGRHKVHYWTRKFPAGWLDAPKVERRKVGRGERK